MIGWLTARTDMARIRYASRLFTDLELPHVSPEALARATAQAVAVAAEWAREDESAGDSQPFKLLAGVLPAGMLETARLHRLLRAIQARLHASHGYARVVMLKQLGRDPGAVSEPVPRTTEIAMGLLVLRAASRIDPDCRAHARTVAGMLRHANTPQHIAAAVDHLQRCHDTDPALHPAPFDREELAQAIRAFVACYAQPERADGILATESMIS